MGPNAAGAILCRERTAQVVSLYKGAVTTARLTPGAPQGAARGGPGGAPLPWFA